jgi:hypothetical protein
VSRATGPDRRAGAGRLAAALAGLLLCLADAPPSLAEPSPCAGLLYAVVGPALLSERIGADAIRLGPDSAAIRSGCEEGRVRIDETPADEHVMRAHFTHCAIAGEEVSVWLKVRDDCSRLFGRVGVLPQRRIRIFEAIRISEEEAAWAPCACEPPSDVATCEGAEGEPCS